MLKACILTSVQQLEGFDCVLRVGKLWDTGMIARNLGELRITNCDSPSNIKNHGKTITFMDLAKHKLIHYVSTLGARSEGFEYIDGEKYRFIKMKGAMTVNISTAYTSACVSGTGIIQAPFVGVSKSLDCGELVEVLSNYRSEAMQVTLIYAHCRHLARRLQIFLDWPQTTVKDYDVEIGCKNYC